MLWVLNILTTRIGQIVAISGISLFLGMYLGNSLTVKYYKAKEIASLNEQVKKNKKVIEFQTKYVSEIRDRELKLEDDLEKALNEAIKSPTAGDLGLPSGSVRRLDSIN